LKRIKGQLDQVKATIIGVVLNGVKAEISPDFEVVSQYKYYHYYGYGGETKKTKAREKRRSHKKPRRLLLLLMALFLPIGALLWQAGVLDLKSYSFQGEPTVEQSSVFLSTVKILKPEKTHSAMSGDAREPVSTPSAPSHESFRIQRIEANTKVGSPENDATPVPRRAIKEFFLAKVSDPRPAPVHYPYSVMTGSFKTVEGANKEISHLNEKSFEAFWTKVDLGEQGIWFRVCVGHFETQRRQRSLKKALASRKAK
jgi:hypothetical protein